MSGNDAPGEFEQIVLLVLAGFSSRTASRRVYEEIVAATGRDVSVAAVHITLGRLVEKGWAEVVERSSGESGEGRARKFYRLAPGGAAVLKRLRDRFDRLWAAAADHPLVLDDGDADR